MNSQRITNLSGEPFIRQTPRQRIVIPQIRRNAGAIQQGQHNEAAIQYGPSQQTLRNLIVPGQTPEERKRTNTYLAALRQRNLELERFRDSGMIGRRSGESGPDYVEKSSQALNQWRNLGSPSHVTTNPPANILANLGEINMSSGTSRRVSNSGYLRHRENNYRQGARERNYNRGNERDARSRSRSRSTDRSLRKRGLYPNHVEQAGKSWQAWLHNPKSKGKGGREGRGGGKKTIKRKSTTTIRKSTTTKRKSTTTKRKSTTTKRKLTTTKRKSTKH